MAKLDYTKNTQVREARFFADPKISEKNKQAVRRFLVSYDVSQARLGMFFSMSRCVLGGTDDILRDMHDPDVMEPIFWKLKQKYAPASMDIIIGLIGRFFRYFNDGEKPKGIRQIKGPSSKDTMRKLNPHDMTTWEEAVAMGVQSKDTQFLAIMTSQVDCGFRPGEFDFAYGDVEIRDGVSFFSIDDGKTGARIVVGYRCAPYIARWLAEHPTKVAKDPLWINRNLKHSHPWNKQPVDVTAIVEYDHAAMTIRARRLAGKLSINKPMDWYSLLIPP